MENRDLAEYMSIGAFPPPAANRLLGKLVANGVEPKIEVDDGIRNATGHYGSGGLTAKVEIFVLPGSLDRACPIRDEELSLTGEV
jgi:hypothetical protein